MMNLTLPVSLLCESPQGLLALVRLIKSLQVLLLYQPQIFDVLTETITQSSDDLTLIKSIAQQNRKALEILYFRYASRLGKFMLRQLNYNHASVDEAINDVMLVVWQKAESFQPNSKVSTWLYGIAYRKAHKARERSLYKFSTISLDLSDEEENQLLQIPSDADTPEEALLKNNLSHILATALQQLSAEHREVVELAIHEGLSYPEIAEIVGCPVNTVKTRMFYARQKLAQYLPKLGIETD